MVTHDSRRRGFTFIDFVALVVMGGVLVVALTAGVRQIPSRDNQVMCLTNLHQIGAAIHAYAAEDPREQAIPIHMNMVGYNDANQPTGAGLATWLWRLANSFAWGGQSATLAFTPPGSNSGYWLSDDPNIPSGTLEPRPEYATAHRPLNASLVPNPVSTLHCPADTGFPPPLDGPGGATTEGDESCWDVFGNSYRASQSGYSMLTPGGGYGGAFSTGPLGHRLATLPNAGRLVLVVDALWFSMLGLNPPATGWHGVPLADNVLFCDGSARLTFVGSRFGPERRPLGADTLALESPTHCYAGDFGAGPTWQLDCYPTPGAVIWGNWSSQLSQNCWPWKNAQLNP